MLSVQTALDTFADKASSVLVPIAQLDDNSTQCNLHQIFDGDVKIFRRIIRHWADDCDGKCRTLSLQLISPEFEDTRLLAREWTTLHDISPAASVAVDMWFQPVYGAVDIQESVSEHDMLQVDVSPVDDAQHRFQCLFGTQLKLRND